MTLTEDPVRRRHHALQGARLKRGPEMTSEGDDASRSVNTVTRRAASSAGTWACRLLPALLSIPVLLLIPACDGAAERRPGSRAEEPGQQADHGEVHWGYDATTGPERWADLSPDFALCRDGKEQSPIDLRNATVVGEGLIEGRAGTVVVVVEERAQVVDLIDNGHTIQVTTNAPVTLEVDGEVFELVQLHFHAPSEHSIDGQLSPLEVHFVHESQDGSLAVIGVLAEVGEHAPALDEIIAALPSGPGQARHIEGLDLPMEELEPLPEHYYRYRGSLTTPPCSEGVHWIVMAQRSQMSAEQIAAFASRLDGNNRPVRPLGERQLWLVSN